MKKALVIISQIILAFWLLAACNRPAENNREETTGEVKQDSIATEEYAHDHAEDHDSSAKNESEIETLYLVIADTGLNYFSLLEEMVAMNKDFGLPIDSMDRYYDKTRKKIILPKNHEDELYAGQYFPRRFPSKSLSVEYLETYRPESNDNTMAIVAGIFEKEKSADSSLSLIKSTRKNAFKLKSDIYLGCAH